MQPVGKMKKAKTVTRRLQLEPSVLDGQVDKNVGDIVRKKYVNYCSKTDGYILDVLDVKIMDCDISPTNSSVQCNVAFTAICMKPRPGDTNVGKICLIFEMGVLLELHGVMKVLVPRDDKGGFEVGGKHTPFNYLDGRYETPAQFGSIELNQERPVMLTGVQYNPQTQTFNCYGAFTSSLK
jgi:hypothetical protein